VVADNRVNGLSTDSKKLERLFVPNKRRLMVTLTTTLSELNRLYGAYYDATCRKDPKIAEQAWKAYVEYVRRYKDERGLL
jgi:hypothetical protein